MGYLKSENIGLPVELRMPTVHDLFGHQARINMASSGNSLSPVEEQGVNFALKVIGRENVTLKEKQMQILRIVIVEKKDVLAVLPTGFGKSLVYQLMAPFADFMDSGFSSTETNSIVLVVKDCLLEPCTF